MTTTLDIPDDLVEDIHLRAEQEGRGLDGWLEDQHRRLDAGLADAVGTLDGDAGKKPEQRP